MARDNIIVTFFLLTAMFFYSSSSLSPACNQNDNTALLAFKNSFHYTSLGRWWSNSSADCCTLKFVGCDGTTGRVISLDFTNVNNIHQPIILNGSIPSSIGDLSALQILAFRSILNLSGPIPPQLSNLKKLLSLTIYETKVSGPIPSFLSQLTSLKTLDLGGNMLTGTIPQSLGNLVNLTALSLFGNQLTGPIPSTLFSRLPKGSLSLVWLTLSSNRLTGAIPTSFVNVDFAQIFLQDNELTGDASVLFRKSKYITVIDLANNNLSFDFSKILFPVNVQVIDVSHNRIYGSIPEQVTQLWSGLDLDVSNNQLCGKIPTGKFGQSASQYEHNKCLCGGPLPACK